MQELHRVDRPDAPSGTAWLREESWKATMPVRVVAHWYCASCDVEGRDAAVEPRCWNCGSTVTVTAQPSVEWAGDPHPAGRSLIGGCGATAA
jgi:hypothetical protein